MRNLRGCAELAEVKWLDIQNQNEGGEHEPQRIYPKQCDGRRDVSGYEFGEGRVGVTVLTRLSRFRFRRLVRCAIAATILCAASSSSHPQTPSNPSSQSPPSTESSSNPSSQSPPSGQSSYLINTKPKPEKPILTLPDFFSHAAQKGIYFHVFLNEELAANPSGGIDQGASASQYLTFGTGIDLGQLIGWRGAALHAIVIAVSSNPLSENTIGGGIDVQENSHPSISCVR